MLLAVRLAFVALIPLGIFLLIEAIKVLRASFFGEILLEAPLLPARSSLQLPGNGLYAIWLKGARAQLAAVREFRPAIWATATGTTVQLARTLARVQASGLDGYRTQAFTFEAPAGSYTVEVGEISRVSGVSGLLVGFLAGPIDPAKLSMQVRKAKPFYYALGGILLCVLSGFLIIGGLILSILAEQLLNAQP